ncbi:MAG: hypothetical protein EKK62_13000, partial [Acidimicrobiia bacterium]
MEPTDDPIPRIQRPRSADRYAPPSPQVARRRRLLVAGLALLVLLGVAALVSRVVDGSDPGRTDAADSTRTGSGSGSEDAGSGDGSGGKDDPNDKDTPKDLTQVPAEQTDQFVNPASSGRMWSAKVPGSLTFRGNPTRTYYGRGDV